jgi:rubrerythrin
MKIRIGGLFLDTEKNLMVAFEGECKAHFRYLAYARQAEEEGKKDIARLFRAVAEAEAVHAMNHLKVLGGFDDTEKNLLAAIDGETYEFTQMYPGFIEQAEKETNTRAALSFKHASDVEKIHNNLYSNALDNLGRNRETEYHVCEICGNTVTGNAPEKCYVCGAGIDKFKLMKD